MKAALHRPIPTDFELPLWTAPLDAQAALAAVPADTTVAGMFLEPMAAVVRESPGRRAAVRDRYVKFRFYPLVENVQLLIDASAILFPGRPLRIGLRKLGRAAPKVMLESTVGKVTIGSADGVLEVLRGIATSLPIYLKPCQAEVVPDGPRGAVVRLRSVHYFLDCHFVGLFEAALGVAGVHGTVRIHSYSASDADLHCAW